MQICQYPGFAVPMVIGKGWRKQQRSRRQEVQLLEEADGMQQILEKKSIGADWTSGIVYQEHAILKHTTRLDVASNISSTSNFLGDSIIRLTYDQGAIYAICHWSGRDKGQCCK